MSNLKLSPNWAIVALAVGAFGIGTYRQDDSVDVRYERDGRSRVAQLPIEPGEAD